MARVLVGPRNIILVIGITNESSGVNEQRSIVLPIIEICAVPMFSNFTETHCRVVVVDKSVLLVTEKGVHRADDKILL